MSLVTLEKPSIAKEFFAKITGALDPVAELTQLVNSASPVFETEWLDFKGAQKIPEKETEAIWSKALSGFANTQGGVIVWGIDARPDKNTGVDAVSGLSLVPNAMKLKSRLNELHAQSTEPPILGVVIEVYPIAGGSGEGFVVCYIPESPFKPHRAEHANRQYVIRAGDDFVTASVSLLRNLFYPQTRCRLIPTLQTARKVDGDYWNIIVTGQVRNAGSATAFDTYVIVHYEPDGLTHGYDGWKTGPVLKPWHGLALHSIHPGISEHFFGLTVSKPTVPEFKFRVQIFARDAEPFEWTFSFSLEEAKRRARIRGAPRPLFF